MGRNRKSDAEHELHGTRPHDRKETDFVAARPKMPPDMPPAAVEEWKRLVPKLCKRKLLTRADASALELYCRIFSRWRQVSLLADQSPMITNARGELVESPASKIACRLEASLRAYQKEFSVTPASRRLTAPPKEELVPAPAAAPTREDTPPIVAETEPDINSEKLQKVMDALL
jgi:P27 family predicted phage terminase small subunit